MSKEARVECLFSFKVEDLGILLVKGQVQWFDEATYESSESLKHAKQIGAVKVDWISRAVAQREATPPWLRRRGQVVRVPPPQRVRGIPQKNQPSTPPRIDVDKIRAEAVAAAKEAAAQAASAAARQAVVETLARERNSGGITPAQLEAALANLNITVPAPPAQNEDVAALVSKLSSLIENLQAAPTVIVPAEVKARASLPAPDIEDEDEPEEMFIPSNIVDSSLSTEIEIAASASEDDSLDAAAAALKKTKKPRRRRKKS